MYSHVHMCALTCACMCVHTHIGRGRGGHRWPRKDLPNLTFSHFIGLFHQQILIACLFCPRRVLGGSPPSEPCSAGRRLLPSVSAPSATLSLLLGPISSPFLAHLPLGTLPFAAARALRPRGKSLQQTVT